MRLVECDLYQWVITDWLDGTFGNSSVPDLEALDIEGQVGRCASLVSSSYAVINQIFGSTSTFFCLSPVVPSES